MEGSAPSPGSLGSEASHRLVEALVELDRLRAEAAAARAARDMALRELLTMQDTLNRVKAVCDMAEWASDVSGGGSQPVSVNVADVRRALRGSA